MNKTNKMKEIMKKYPEYQDALFKRGYLITTYNQIDLNDYPFYNKWKIYKVHSKFNIYVSLEEDFYKYTENQINLIMIGHAYNPFNMKYNEEELLKDACEAYKDSQKKFFDIVNELTGIYVIIIFDKEEIMCVQDCGGMKSCYFGIVNNNIYITSHTQLVADICNLEMDKFVRKLVKTKCYNIGNRYLPGNITSYKELKRLGCNTYLKYLNNEFSINRFYPIKPHKEIKNKKEYDDTIKKISQIMHNNCILATKKWKNPAISLSGGMDSKTTLAVANGLYEKFKIYSFHCKESEVVDSKAAHKICEKIGLEHTIYPIPSKNEEIKNFKILKSIINHNMAYMRNIADHEIRKEIFLYQKNIKIDIELKSWVSEIGRAYLERRYGIKFPENLNERIFNIFQTRYFLHPVLMKKADKIWANFMKEVGLISKIYNYEHSDLYYWEVRMASWGANATQALEIGNKTTMPFNNRKLIEMFLSFDHETRKKDEVHKSVIEISNEAIYNMNLTIKNPYHNPYRIMLDKTYYKIRTLFYHSKLREKR